MLRSVDRLFATIPNVTCARSFAGMQALILGLLLSTTQSIAQSPSTHVGQLRSSGPTSCDIDANVAEMWQEFELKPSAKATDSEWLRRVFLDLIGRIPTFEEVTEFLVVRDRNKRTAVVDGLLSTEYAAEFARHWTDYWTNLLIGRTGGFENNSLTSRVGLEDYVRESIRQNRPYDDFVTELISATGTNSPGSERFNGAVNYLTMKLDEKATLATSKTAQLFLGQQVQCTQCHNHPFNENQQSQFWELNSFFRQTVALRRFQTGSRQIRTVELTDQDFRGEGNTPEEAEIYYEQRNGILKAAYPAFVDGAPLDNRSGYLESVNRRVELAHLVANSPLLSESVVNRMWGYFLGYGFTSPVDDMGAHKAPSHPQLLDELARRFEQNSYDLRKLMRQIVLSTPYSLSSRANRTNTEDDPSLGETPKFSRFYLRQLLPEQLYESMLVISAGKPVKTNNEQVSAAKRRWLRQFTQALGNDEGGESSSFNGTIPQTLMMFNGRLIREATSRQSTSPLATIAASDERFEVKVDRIYLTCLTRKPTRKESKLASRLVMARMDERSSKRDGASPEAAQKATLEGLRDLVWVLTNSNEFILNH